MCGSGRKKQCCAKYTRATSNLTSDEINCTRPCSQCSFGEGVCRLLLRQFLNLFAQFKTTKSHENYVFLYPFSNMAISPRPPKKQQQQNKTKTNQQQKTLIYTSKLYGLTGMRSHVSVKDPVIYVTVQWITETPK